VHQSSHVRAEDVAHAGTSKIELVVLDISGTIRKRSPIDPDQSALAMQLARESPAEPSTDARDDDGPVVREERARRLRHKKMLLR
jgi:hypothetical protein